MKTNKKELGPISAVRVFVHDLDKARAFYKSALGLPVNIDTPKCVILQTGTAQLIIEPVARDDAAHSDFVGRFTGISFDVDDIWQTYNRLRERGVKFDGAPAEQDWGGILAHFSDPDGNTISMVQHP